MIATLIRFRAPVLLVVLCIFAIGLFNYVSLPRESFPEIDIPTVMVTTPYVGVAPADIESLVTVPLENELSGLTDLKKMSSTSAEGVSLIMLEFEPEVTIEDKLQRVRDRVSRASNDLPDDAEDTEVQEISFDRFPIMIVAISGPADEEVLKELGEDLEEEVGRIDGVLEAEFSGGQTRQIRVQVDPVRLTHYKLSLNDVIGAIASENVNIPGGDVKAGDANFLVRVPGDFKAATEIEKVAIKRIGDRPVFVGDIATVVDGFEDRTSYSRVNGHSAVTLAVSKRAGSNILEIADEVKRITAAHQEKWPKGVTARIVGDQSRDIRMMVAELENNVITALILVVSVVVFFMGARNSFFVAFAIPLSMLLGIIAISAFGMTLNMIVLFSLILGLGMLVDNAIVLVENIYRHVEAGKSLRLASIVGTKEVAMAVAASTATTVAAFLPLVFWTGIMGQFMGYLPKTVIALLVASLAVAIGILPVATSIFMKRAKPKDDAASVEDGTEADNTFMQKPFMKRYKRVLEWSLAYRYITLAVGVLSLFGTFVAYFFLGHGTEFFPDTEPNQAIVTVKASDGTDLEATDSIVRQVEAVLARESNIDFYVVETGVSGGGDPISGAMAVANEARVTVDFLPHRTRLEPGQKPRREDPRKTIEHLRGQLVSIPGAVIEIEKREDGPPVGAAIAVEVSGDDFHEVGEAAQSLRRELLNVEGVAELSDNYKVGRPEMRLRIDRGAAKRVGASTQAVASAIRAAINGAEATTIRDGEDEYDVIVEAEPRYRGDLQAVMALRIPGREDTSPDTFAVPLSSVASYKLAGGSGSIRHVDQDLVVTITGDVTEGANANEVQARVAAYLEEDADLPAGMHARLGGAQDEQKESQAFLGKAFIIAVCLIAIVLVTQFNSFFTPAIILFTVILSIVGVLWGLVFTGTAFGVIMTGIGVISLAGIVVNNAIVLLDYVEQLRDRGYELTDALVRAGMVRFRPVILTALTTILGLVPMAIGVSVDFFKRELILGSQTAAWWSPMAVAVIFGLAFATVLTLVMVPTLYSIKEDVVKLMLHLKMRGLANILDRRPKTEDTDESEELPAPAKAA